MHDIKNRRRKSNFYGHDLSISFYIIASKKKKSQHIKNEVFLNLIYSNSFRTEESYQQLAMDENSLFLFYFLFC